MAFQGMLGHLAHPVTTPVWGRDKCSAAPAICTRSGQRARTRARELTVWGGSPHWMWVGRDGIIWNRQKTWTSREQVAVHHSPRSTCAQGRLANQRRSQQGLRGKAQISNNPKNDHSIFQENLFLDCFKWCGCIGQTETNANSFLLVCYYLAKFSTRPGCLSKEIILL